MQKSNYKKIATDIRKKVLKMKLTTKGSHIGGAFSCIDILTMLYFKILHINPKKPKDQNRDRFILSKGHAASALYATLVQRGFAPEEALKQYCQDGSTIAGHAMRDSIPGVEVSTGSLGHGLSIGIGMAVAAKRDGRKNRVFVMLSDGECDEGSVWEGALFSSHHRLDNLVAIIDYNKIQSFGTTREVLDLEPFSKKWESFGWQVKEVNGHDFKDLEKVFLKLPVKKDFPTVIIAHTVKGKGVSFMEHELKWHYKNPDEEQYQIALKELEKQT